MWEGKIFAAADADAAETDWKHKVTPERGDLKSERTHLVDLSFVMTILQQFTVCLSLN